jgi:hypothetical protein
MSFLGIGSSTAAPQVVYTASQAQALSTGGGVVYGPGQTVAGAYSAQPPSGVKTILKNALVFGGLGAALGFGASFFTLPIIGQVGAPIAAAVGGGVGALFGIVKGILQVRKQNLGMKSQIANNAGMQPISIPNPAPLRGGTYGINAKSAYVKHTQNMLKRLGLYAGKITGKMDAGTAAAIKHYESLKGAPATGKSTPELRSVMAQDVQIAAQLK